MTELRICFVGDSITQGTGDDTALGWPGRLIAAARAQGHDFCGYNHLQCTCRVKKRYRKFD